MEAPGKAFDQCDVFGPLDFHLPRSSCCSARMSLAPIMVSDCLATHFPNWIDWCLASRICNGSRLSDNCFYCHRLLVDNPRLGTMVQLSQRMQRPTEALLPKINSSLAQKTGPTQVVNLATAENWLIRKEVLQIYRKALQTSLTCAVSELSSVLENH